MPLGFRMIPYRKQAGSAVVSSGKVRARGFRGALALLLALASPSATRAVTAPLAAPATSINERMTGDVTPVHDPAIIKAGDTYYVFSTSQVKEGKGLIHIRSSKDLVNWRFVGSVFPQIPDWAKKLIPGTEGIWAPDISYVNGRYRLYYAVSTFGSNRSVIGLATNATLDPSSPEYAWRDEGLVVQSSRWHDYNAIDPNFLLDRNGNQWLAFGSFWSGIKMIRLNPATGKPSAVDKTIYSLAERSKRENYGAIEAPFIIEHGGYYYLFAAFDLCCRGADSSYYTVVGRSKDVTGPYLDRSGKPMLKSGGFLVLHAQLDPTKRWRGPGGASILRAEGRDFIVYHSYDAKNKGAPTLRIQPLGWSPDGWPVAL
jgi:arabinan endo-1,5-alpha-L-arabinosidase